MYTLTDRQVKNGRIKDASKKTAIMLPLSVRFKPLLTLAIICCSMAISSIVNSSVSVKPASHHATFDNSLLDGFFDAYKGFQTDADIVRLQQMKYWVELIEEYHDKTGKYPFQGKTKGRLYVFIATPNQQQYTYKMDNESHETMANFVSILEQGLGREIAEHYDPQYAPDAKPNYYIYALDNDRYYFAIHTHQHYPFSRNVRQYYNKVEVSNEYTANAPHILTPSQLFKSAAYKNAANKEQQKPMFFEQRDALTLHATKEK